MASAGSSGTSRLDRRVLLQRAGSLLAGGSALALGACSTKPPKHPPTTTPGAAPSRPDVRTLNALLDLEHKAIAAYTAGIPLLSGTALAAAKQFLSHEFSHAEELSTLIRKGHGKPVAPAASYELGNPQSAAEVLDLLHRIEQGAIAAYLAALPKLTSGGVRATIAATLANEAEHISVLRTALGQTAVPSAFVTAAQ